mgnify:CR=1 FL=1
MNFSYGDHIPIFISVHDKVEQLKISIDSYEKNIKSPIKIVLFDHNTSYKPCLDYLDSVKDKYKVYVHRDKKFLKFGDEIRRSRNQNLIKCIKDYIKHNQNINYICVTDTDIELLENTEDIFEKYVEYYKTYKNINQIISTGIQINDIDKNYKFYDRVMRSELPHWKNKVDIKLNSGTLKCFKTATDTTFKLYHKSWFDSNPKTLYTDNSLRTDYPYVVKHLDWYITKKNITPDLKHYSKTSRNSHYMGKSFFKYK